MSFSPTCRDPAGMYSGKEPKGRVREVKHLNERQNWAFRRNVSRGYIMSHKEKWLGIDWSAVSAASEH